MTRSPHIHARLRATSLWTVAAALLIGCGGQTERSGGSCTITPGVGIRGRLEIGMSLDEVKKHYHGVECEESQEEHVVRVTIPTLGFSGIFYEESKRLGQMFFVVRRLPQDDADPCAEMGRFTGSISGGISFSQGDVLRGKVVATFGGPEQVVARLGDSDEAFKKQREALWRAWEDGRAFEHRAGGDTAILYYPTNGIAFVVEGTVVEEVRVFPPDDSGEGVQRR